MKLIRLIIVIPLLVVAALITILALPYAWMLKWLGEEQLFMASAEIAGTKLRDRIKSFVEVGDEKT